LIFDSDSLTSEFAEALDKWFVITKPFGLEFADYGEETGDQFELMRFQESPEAADDIKSMIFSEISSKPLIDQHACVRLKKSGGDGVTFSSVEHVETWVRMARRGLNGDPIQSS
jgi:hypothetical protein